MEAVEEKDLGEEEDITKMKKILIVVLRRRRRYKENNSRMKIKKKAVNWKSEEVHVDNQDVNRRGSYMTCMTMLIHIYANTNRPIQRPCKQIILGRCQHLFVTHRSSKDKASS